MAKIRFYLKDPSKKNTCIFMICYFGVSKLIANKKQYLPLKYYINESISPAHWNKRTGRARKRQSHPCYDTLNERLRIIENTTLQILFQFRNNAVVPTREKLREALDNALQKGRRCKQPVKTSPFFSFIEQFITESSSIKSTGTIIQYKNTLRLLKRFSNEQKVKLYFDNINLEFHTNLRQYMSRAGYSETYFGNQIRVIRLFMNEALERGLTKNTQHKSRKFVSPIPSPIKIYLTEKEITKVQWLDLSTDEQMENIRNLFVIACRTGLRYSDLIQLKPANFIEDNKLLRIETLKTGELIYIPICPDVTDICEKYAYQFPKISNVKFNFYIKHICHLAGITDDVEILTMKGGIKCRKLFKKYELVSAHTARRSFATNAYLANIPSIAIMHITGHRTEKSFMKYIRISSENNARQLLLHPHFLACKEAS